MTNYLQKLALTGMMTLAAGSYTGGTFNSYPNGNEINPFAGYSLEERVRKGREEIFEQKAEEQNSDEIKIPYFKIGSGNCSEYAKLSAKKLFGKEYAWDKKKKNGGAAWNLRYYNPVINEIDSIGEIKELIINGDLEPGMIIGMYNPKSKHNRKKDITGNKVKYTHAILYVGLDKERKPEFFHQLGSKIERITISDIKEFEEKGWKVMEVIDVQDNFSQD